MKLLDSTVWVEHVADGPRASKCEGLFDDPGQIVVSTVNLYEVGRYVRRTGGVEAMEEVLAHMRLCRLWHVDVAVSTLAIELAAEYKLAIADALIAATAELSGAELLSFDGDLLQLPGAVEPAG